MNKVNLNKQIIEGNLLSPLPVILVGANVRNKPNYLVIGYSCPFDFGKYIFFSLSQTRYTTIGIHENMTFSVNIPSEDLVEKTNICGNKSGRDIDKSSLFDNFYGELKTAPMIRECPVNIECEVHEILDYNRCEGIIGKVIKSYVNPKYTVKEKGKVKLDWRKIHPFIWVTGGDFNYYRLGDRIITEEEE
ncbi:MAG: flavin reductase family protein [Candidatus Thorarchaeota archaeon]